MKKTLFTVTAILTITIAVWGAEKTKPTLYIDAQDGFDTYVTAAIAKKEVPVEVVTDKSKADYVLQASAVQTHKESNGGKIARCLFAYCAGIEDRGNVSVKLVKSESTAVVWAYAVNKGRGQKNDQSMAEAIAKHLKEYFK